MAARIALCNRGDLRSVVSKLAPALIAQLEKMAISNGDPSHAHGLSAPYHRNVATNSHGISMRRVGNAPNLNSTHVLFTNRKLKPLQASLRKESVARALEVEKFIAIVIPRSANEPGLTARPTTLGTFMRHRR
jgi:hypothetical protein